VAIDATHFESRDRSTQQEKKSTPEPKKRGRKQKVEQEAFNLEVQEKENLKSIYEKKIEEQLLISQESLRNEAPLEPNWGIKKIVKVRIPFGSRHF
jgi:transposase